MINDQLLDLHEVERITNQRRSTVYKGITAGTFPTPRKVGAKLAWLSSEVSEWMEALPKADIQIGRGSKASSSALESVGTS
jgi:prophage regulatory protein